MSSNYKGKKPWKSSKESVKPKASSYQVTQYRTHVTGSTPKANDSGLLFNAGTGLAWNIASERIYKRFQRKKLERYIDGAEIELEDGTIGWTEIEFNEPEPNEAEMIDDQVGERFAETNDLYDELEQQIMDGEFANEADRQRELRANARTRAEKLYNLREFRSKMRGEFETVHARWWKHKKDFEKEQTDVHEIFAKSIDEVTLGLVQRELGARQFTRAWKMLERQYGETNGNADQLTVTMAALHGMVYDPATTMGEHIMHINALADKMEKLDHSPYSAAKRRGILIESVRKSPVAAQYEATISNMKFAPMPWEEVCARFRLVYEETAMRQEAGLGHGDTTREAELHTAEAKTPRHCNNCGKWHPGKCNQGPNCFNCKKPGHMKKDCPKLKNKKGGGGGGGGGKGRSGGDDGGGDNPDDDGGGGARHGNGGGQSGKGTSFSASSSRTNKMTAYRTFCSSDLEGASCDGDQTPAAMTLLERADEISPAGGREPMPAASGLEPTAGSWSGGSGVEPRREADHLRAEVRGAILLRAVVSRGTKSRDPELILIDSGASRHMTHDASLVMSMREATGPVMLGCPGATITVRGVGGTRLPIVSSVLYVPELSVSVLSVSQFTDEGYEVTFHRNWCVVRERATGAARLTGTRRRNLYYLDGEHVALLRGQRSAETPRLYAAAGGAEAEVPRVVDVTVSEEPVHRAVTMQLGAATAGTSLRTGVIHTADMDDEGEEEVIVPDLHTGWNKLEQLHRRWGHVSEGYIKDALRDGLVTCSDCSWNEIKDLKMRPCFDCMKGRMRARPTVPASETHRDVLEKIAFDFKGLFPIASYYKKRGFFLVSDRASNFVRAYTVKSKDEAAEVLEKFHSEIAERYGHTIAVVQCDPEPTNISEEVRLWLRDKRIHLQTSPPHEHSKNGQIERAMQSVMDKARTLMASYNVPQSYWEFAVQYACYCINRCKTAGRPSTPLEMVTGVKPNISRMVPFYAPGVYYLSKEERAGKAWAHKAAPCRMLGYSEDCEGAYLVLNVPTRSVMVRANCVFDTELTREELADLHPEFAEDDLAPDEYTDTRWYDAIDDGGVRVGGDKKDSSDSGTESEGVTDREGCSEISEFYCLSDHYHASYLDHWWNDCVMAHNALELPPNPRTVEEALALPDGQEWQEAIDKEMQSFADRGTWGEAIQSGRGMKTRMILKYQFDNEYNLKRKARLVVCGYSQVKGVDYHDTYSPTTTSSVIFLILHIAASRGWSFRAFDVSAAYLEGKADTEMYAWLPANLCKSGKRTRVEILGNWYGEKQAGRIWNTLFHEILTSMGFKRCPMMPCLYLWKDHEDEVLLSIHVDDGIMAANDERLYDDFMESLLKRVRSAKMYVSPQKFLGMEPVPLDDGRILLRQQGYIEEHFGAYGGNVRTPMSNLTNLRRAVANSANPSLLEDTGRFRFTADRTRPDLLASTGEVSRGGDKSPSDLHLQVSKRIKSYLANTKELGLIFGGQSEPELFGYCDASYITEGDAKCRLGGCLFLGAQAGAFESFSRTAARSVRRKRAHDAETGDSLTDIVPEGDEDETTSSLSHSSTEAEIKAIDETVRLVQYWLEILDFLHFAVSKPVKIYVDNRSSIELCRVLKSTHAVKHINMRIQYIHEMISLGIVGLHFIPSELNVADMLTKPLPIAQFERHRRILLEGHSADEMRRLAECAGGGDERIHCLSDSMSMHL